MRAITFQQEKITPKIKLKSVALPVEHGGWGFLFEPIFVGLLIAPSWAGLFLSLSAVGVFLTRQPLRLVILDLRLKKNSARTGIARKFTLLYASVALIFFVLAVLTSAHAFWFPILLAAPFALVQLSADSTNNSRSLSAELSGATALAAIASCITLAFGWPTLNALSIWLILLARIIPSILYVRAKLRLNKGLVTSKAIVLLSHAIGLAIVVGVFWLGLGPLLVCVALLILLLRASHGLSTYSKQTNAKIVGICEVIYGVLTAVLLVAGYSFSI